MAQPLKVIPLLQLLNDSAVPVPFAAVCEALRTDPDTLRLTCDFINDFDPVLCRDEGRLSLRRKLDLLDEAYLQEHIDGKGRVSVLPYVDSTNSVLARFLTNCVSGDLTAAELQTKGRGRRGNGWLTSIGRQLTFSLCEEFAGVEHTAGLSLLTGLAVVRALSACGIEGAVIKWPNDIYIEGQKVCGILVENFVREHDVLTIIGIGLNVYTDADNEKLLQERKVTALEPYLKDKEGFSRNILLCTVVNTLKSMLHEFSAHGFAAFLEEWERYDFLLGHWLEVEQEDGTLVQGLVRGVNEEGCLLLDDGYLVRPVISAHILSIDARR